MIYKNAQWDADRKWSADATMLKAALPAQVYNRMRNLTGEPGCRILETRSGSRIEIPGDWWLDDRAIAKICLEAP